MLLSPNFTLEEFTLSQTAVRRGINNYPPPDILDRMRTVTAPGMERVRSLLGTSCLISSGYRSPPLNVAVGGSSTSDHQWGWAVDFTSPRFGTPLAVARKIAASDIEFDQLIHEFGRWVHISFSPKMRGQLLTIDGQGTRQAILPVRK